MVKKKHHYVPKTHLHRFAISASNSQVWVIDKTKKEVRPCSIEDICEENYFYRLPFSNLLAKGELSQEDYKALDEACLKDYGKRLSDLTEDEKTGIDFSIEDHFADHVEPRLRGLFDEIDAATFGGNLWVAKNCWFITEENKYELSWLLAQEFVRTRYYRDVQKNMMSEGIKHIAPILAQFHGVHLCRDSISVDFSKDQERLLHAEAILDENATQMFASLFFSDVWILFENLTTEPFCCLDNGIMLCPSEKVPAFYGYGLGTYGMQILFPISPKLMLVMLDSEKFKQEKTKHDRRIMVKTDRQFIEDINLRMIKNSYRFVVFSDETTAKRYKQKCDENPLLYEQPSKGEVY